MTPRSSVAARQMIVQRVEEVLAGLSLGALILNARLGPLSVLLFLIFGGLLLLVNVRLNVRSLLAWWPLLILPAYCLVSTLWSQFPAQTFRYSVQMTFTLAVGIVIAGRIPVASMLRVLFIVYGLAIALSVLIGQNGGVAWIGLFGSKNAFASQIALFALIAIGISFDNGAPRWMRLLAVIGALSAVPLMLKAQSAGTLAALMPTALLVLFILLSRRMSDMQKLFVLLATGVVATFLVLVLLNYGDAILSKMLDSTGKDLTLTGRTDLWAIAATFIAERPLLGVGYHAFWIAGYAPAESLWAMFDVASGSGFNFHNLYISNAVELGFIGLGIQVVMLYLAAALLAVLAVMRPSPAIAAFTGLHALLILRSFIEVEVFSEFGIRSILAYCTLIYAAREFSILLATRRPRAEQRLVLGAAQ